MIFLATLLFPLALQIFADEPPPPGPTVPRALADRPMSRLDEVDLSQSLSRKKEEARSSSACRRGSQQLRLTLGGQIGERRDRPAGAASSSRAGTRPARAARSSAWSPSSTRATSASASSPRRPPTRSATTSSGASGRRCRAGAGWPIFDRSWYGRVLVERVEGFATREQWLRAYDEINDFERSLADEGMILIKIWMHISAEEQLRRFERREQNPLKAWKLTDEDWRNREKRDALRGGGRGHARAHRPAERALDR